MISSPWLRLASLTVLTGLMVGASASPASAQLFRRRVVVVPSTTYVVPTTVYAAPTVVEASVRTVYTPARQVVVAPPLRPTVYADPMLTRTMVAAPVARVVEPAPAVVETVVPRRMRVVVPRRVYRYYGW